MWCRRVGVCVAGERSMSLFRFVSRMCVSHGCRAARAPRCRGSGCGRLHVQCTCGLSVSRVGVQYGARGRVGRWGGARGAAPGSYCLSVSLERPPRAPRGARARGARPRGYCTQYTRARDAPRRGVDRGAAGGYVLPPTSNLTAVASLEDEVDAPGVRASARRRRSEGLAALLATCSRSDEGPTSHVDSVEPWGAPQLTRDPPSARWCSLSFGP